MGSGQIFSFGAIKPGIALEIYSTFNKECRPHSLLDLTVRSPHHPLMDLPDLPACNAKAVSPEFHSFD